MSAVLAALIQAALQSIGEIINQVGNGTLTEAQAEQYLTDAVNHYKASRAAWDQAGKS